ncbi:MAG: zf-HC2 domain-containing protein [Anaerolineales bacterium]|jgi:predicted anti-sigma-YlaC factor YlaD
MERDECRRLLGSLSAYLDGEAEARVCQAIQEHLASCEDCRVVVDTLRRTISLVHQTPLPELSPAARERIWRVLQQEGFVGGGDF